MLLWFFLLPHNIVIIVIIYNMCVCLWSYCEYSGSSAYQMAYQFVFQFLWEQRIQPADFRATKPRSVVDDCQRLRWLHGKSFLPPILSGDVRRLLYQQRPLQLAPMADHQDPLSSVQNRQAPPSLQAFQYTTSRTMAIFESRPCGDGGDDDVRLALPLPQRSAARVWKK